MNNENDYKENFVRSGLQTMEDVKYKYNAILEAHPVESGWEVGEPKVTKNPLNGTYTIEVPLTKHYDKVSGYRR
jgi:hypothetical protein